MHELAKNVAARPPAAGSAKEAEFFGNPAHISARIARDVLAGDAGTVRERILDIMPHIVQARAPATRTPSCSTSDCVLWLLLPPYACLLGGHWERSIQHQGAVRCSCTAVQAGRSVLQRSTTFVYLEDAFCSVHT